jgi:hypothetical protein
MSRPDFPALLSLSILAAALGGACGSTPRDQSYGSQDGSNYEVPFHEAQPETSTGGTSGAGGASGDDGGAAAGGVGGAAGAGGTAGATDAASDAISDAGADG